MAENGLNHLVYHENGETGGYDNEAFNHHHPEKLKRRKSIEDRERHTVTPENGHLPASPTNCLTNGHDSDHAVPSSPSLTNGSAVVVLDSDDSGTQNGPQDSSLEELNVNLNVDTSKELKCPLDTKLRHYVPLDNEGKMLNSEDELRIAIPDDAIINFNTGRIRIQNQQNKSHSPLPKSCHVETEEKIPMQDMSCTLPQEDSEKALEAAQNGRTSEDYNPDANRNEKQGNGAGPFDEYFIPVNTRKKYLRGEKLYLTKDSKQLCQNWRRVIICGLIAIVVAVAVLVGVLAATGILLAESESKTTRHEINGHSLLDTASIALAGKHLPRPSKVPQKKYLPLTTISVPESTTSFSQSVSEVTPIVPVVQPNSSQSHTIVPNALVGEFTIVDENYTYDLSDHTSNGYLSLATQLETELSKIFETSGGHFQEVKILKFRPGSIIVRFVVVWENEHGVILAKRAYQIVKEYLKSNNNLISSYRVKGSSLNFIDVINECHVQNGGCMYDCQWSYQNLTKTCICQNNMELMPDGKSCVEKEFATEHTTEKEIWTVDVSYIETTREPELTTSVGTSSENGSEITTIISEAETAIIPQETTSSTSLFENTDTLLTDSMTIEPTVDNTVTSEASTTVSSEIRMNETIGTKMENEITTPAPAVTTVEEKITAISPLYITVLEMTTVKNTEGTSTIFGSDEISTVTEINATTDIPKTAVTFQAHTALSVEEEVTSVPTTTTVGEIIASPQPDEMSTQFSIDTAINSTFLPNLETTVPSNTDVGNSVNESEITTMNSVTVSTMLFTPNEEMATTVPSPVNSNVNEHTNYSNSETTTELGVTAVETTTSMIYTAVESNNSVTSELNTDSSTPISVITTMQPAEKVTDVATHETSVPAMSTSTMNTTTADEGVGSTLLNSNFTNNVNRTPEVRFFNNESDFRHTDFNFHASSTENYEETVLVTTDLNNGGTTTASVMTTTLKPVMHQHHHRHHTTTEPTNIYLTVDVTHTTENSNDLNSVATTELVTEALTESAFTEAPNMSLTMQNPESATTTTISIINEITTPFEFIDSMHNESDTSSFVSATTSNITSDSNNFVNTTIESTTVSPHDENITMNTAENEGNVTTQNVIHNINNMLSENTTVFSNITDLKVNVTTLATTDSLSEFSIEHSTSEKTVSATEQPITTTMLDFELSTMGDSDDFTNLYNTFDEFSKLSTEDDYDLSNSTMDDTTMMNVTEGLQCREDQFMCSSLNLCLNNSFMCDGIEDCPDGLDESECTETCNLNFKCENSSVCIMSDAHCDGIWDCTDGSDEQNCTPTECAKHEVMCLDGSTCIKPGHICDWKYNCRDRSDEVGCVERTTCETGGRFFCNDGLCIPWSLKCDGNYDCKDKEDEGNCTCLEDEFKCNDGKCLKSSSRCDGHRDCINAEDESGCVNVDENGMVVLHESYSSSSSLLCADDWTLDDGHYLCQELGFGHALFTNVTHVAFEGSWMAMKRINVTSSSLWTERVTYTEKCSSNLAAGVVCQKIECGNYSGLLHRRRKRQSDGLSSSTTQWPFIAYVSTSRSSKGCVSEILTPVWLITSAECLLSIGKEPHNGSDWYVRTNVAKGFNSDVAQKHEVLKIVLHPHSSKFRSLILRDYDVALIRLKHALVFSDKIGAICLPEEQVAAGITCFSGVLGTERPRAPPPQFPTFSSLAMMVLDRDSCNVPDHYNDQINNRMLCTKSSDSQSVCDNDEGTPLMCLSGINKWYLAGMLSYQRLCGVYNWHPAVFSNIFAMRNYIDQVIGQRQYGTKYDNTIYTIMPSTTTGSSTITEITTEPILTTESEYESTLSTSVGALVASDRLSDQQFDSTANGTYVDIETTTVYLIDTEEVEISNVTEDVRMVNVTESDELFTTGLSDNNTSNESFTTEETHANTSAFVPLSNSHESLPLKQPMDSETGFDSNVDMLKDSPEVHVDSKTISESSELTTVPVSLTEDFIVETVRPNITEQQLGYMSLVNVTTLAPENVSQMDTSMVATITINATSQISNSSDSDKAENVTVYAIEASSYQHTPSPSLEVSGVTQQAETTIESRTEHNSSSHDNSVTSAAVDMETKSANISNSVATENEHDTDTVNTTFHAPVNGMGEMFTNQGDMLVKEYIVRSRNIDMPLKFSVTNSTVVVEEVKTITPHSLEANNSVSDIMFTESSVSADFENITGTLVGKAALTEDSHEKSQELNATAKYDYLSTYQDTTLSEIAEFSTVKNVTEYQNSTSEVITHSVPIDDSSNTTLH